MRHFYFLAILFLMTSSSFGAELFVRVLRPGSHMATTYNQTQTNTTNTFRFFELPGGNLNLQITDQQTGYSVYNGYVNIAANQRVVAELDQNGNLQIIQTSYITTTNWYTTNPGNVVYNPNPYPSQNTGGYGNPNGTTDPAFAQFLQLLDNESFDSRKLELANNYVSKTNLYAQQITDISKKFTFDSNRLEWAKHAYNKCYDKTNYFLLKSTFTFTSNYSALEEYMEGQ